MLALVLTASLFSTLQKSMPCAAVLIPPSISQASWIKAVALFQMDDRITALRELDRLVKDKPGDCFLLSLRGLLREKDGNLAGAADDFALILKANASNDWAQERRDRCFRFLAVGESNLKFLLASMRSGPGSFLCSFHDDAEECGGPARHILLHLLDRHIQKNPSDNCAICLRGLLRHADGRLTEAIEDYSAYLWAVPSDADVYMFQAMAQHAAGNTTGALISASQLVELDPHHGPGQRAFAYLLVQANRLDDARKAFDKSIALNSDNGLELCIRGHVRARLGDRTGAIEDFSKLAGMGSPWVEFSCYSSLVRASAGDLDRALTEAQEAVRLHPSWVTYYNRAIIRGLREETGNSIADLVLSSRMREGDDLSLSTSKGTRFTIKSTFRAEGLLNNKQQGQFYLNEAVALILLGKREQAAACFNYATSLKCSQPRAYAIRGLYYAAGGEYTSALADLHIMLRPTVSNDYANSSPSGDNDEQGKNVKDGQSKKESPVDRLSFQNLSGLIGADSDPMKSGFRPLPSVEYRSTEKEPQQGPK